MKIERPRIQAELPNETDFRAKVREAINEGTEVENLNVSHFVIERADWSRTAFHGMVFENCQFSACEFHFAKFFDSRFVHCDLSNSNFSDALFSRCEIIGSKWIGSSFSRAVLKNTAMDKSDFQYCAFTESVWNTVSVRESNFSCAHLDSLKKVNASISLSNFNGADFFRTPLKGIDLSDSEISGILLSETKSELQGLSVNMIQAADFARMLGLIIK